MKHGRALLLRNAQELLIVDERAAGGRIRDERPERVRIGDVEAVGERRREVQPREELLVARFGALVDRVADVDRNHVREAERRAAEALRAAAGIVVLDRVAQVRAIDRDVEIRRARKQVREAQLVLGRVLGPLVRIAVGNDAVRVFRPAVRDWAASLPFDDDRREEIALDQQRRAKSGADRERARRSTFRDRGSGPAASSTCCRTWSSSRRTGRPRAGGRCRSAASRERNTSRCSATSVSSMPSPESDSWRA